MSMSAYAASGVDIDAGERFARLVHERVARAWPDSENPIGGFAGRLTLRTPTDAVTACTDGAGTMAILAASIGHFDVIGQNAAAMSLGDAYVSGAPPVGLLDVVKVGKLDPEKHIAIVDGMIRALKQAGHSCLLLGGETAEMPGLFRYPWMVDVDTTAIGVPENNIVTGPVAPGHAVYGWRSDGPAANGFSLIRRVFGLMQPARMVRRLHRQYPELGETLADALLKPAPVWINQIEVQRHRGVKFSAHAHITGGGMVDNIPRVLPDTCKVILDRSQWHRPPIFRLIEEVGKVSPAEMDRVFNQGMMVVSMVAPDGAAPDTPNVDLIGRVERRHGDEPPVQFTGSF